MLDSDIISDLEENFYIGCLDAVELIKSSTPIDTKRLFTSIRVEDLTNKDNQIKAKIVLGGVELYGILREQDIIKPVNYALYVEARSPFIRPILSEIKQAIINRLKK